MIRRKTKPSSKADNATQVKPVKKTQKKAITQKKIEENSSVRIDFTHHINNPDVKIEKKGIEKQIKSFDNRDLNFQLVLLSIETSKSYTQFDYETMKDFIDNEFKVSYKTAHKILTQARIAFDIGGVEALGKYSGNALDTLKNLDKEERKEVFSLIQESDPKSVTKAVMLKAITELGYIEEIGDQHKRTKQKVSKIHNMLKISTTKNEFIDNIVQAFHENLREKDIKKIIKKLSSGLEKYN